MDAREAILKYYKPVIIIILLFTLAFTVRAEAFNINGVTSASDKAFYEDSNGQPYFSEIDSYYNLRMTEDYLKNGYIGDSKVNGTEWDSLSYYPSGREADATRPGIVLLTAFTYKFVNLFGNMPLTEVAFWLPVFIGSLAVIPSYFFVRRLTNDYGGIAAALLAATAPAYVSHNFAGFFTTEMFNVVLPLFIVWFFVESVRAKNLRNKTIFVCLSAIFVLFYSFAWSGWTFILYVVVAATILYLIISYVLQFDTIKKRSDYSSIGKWFINQPVIFPLVIFIILSIIFTLISVGPSNFLSTILGPLGFPQLQSSTLTNSNYPNAYISVAELQVPSVTTAIVNSGGFAAVIFAAIGVFLIFWRLRSSKPEKSTEIKNSAKTRKSGNKTPPQRKRRRYKSKSKKTDDQKNKSAKKTPGEKYVIPDLTAAAKKNYLFYGILLAVWILGMVYSLNEGTRFALELSTPIALAAGIFIGLIYEYVKRYTNVPSYRTIIIVVLIVIAVFSPISGSYALTASVVPGTDDSMVNSLNWIKQNTSNNTVIMSWWDFGHLFTYQADRPVTFDGGTQNTPRAYWVGKALVTDNESLSIGIFRMLSTSGDLAPETLDNYTKNTSQSVAILNSTLGVDNATAYNIMTTQYGLTPVQANTILNYTHPANPNPFVLITSSDMIGKAYWWSYFGNWNFQTNNSTAYSYQPDIATTLPSNITGQLPSNTTILYSNNTGVILKSVNNNITAGLIDSSQIQNQNQSITQIFSELISGLNNNSSSLVMQPHKLIVVQGNNVTQNEIVSNSSSFSIIVNNQNGTYETVVMDKGLEDSMFTKLYILGGMNTTQYKFDYAQSGVTVWTA